LKRSLLDINVLIALLDLDHTHHREARKWLEVEAKQGWASCPITQNGCVRVMSQEGYPNPLPISSVIARLSVATQTSYHEFWPDDVSILGEAYIQADRVHGPKQITDIYLLALAVQHNGRLVTFDATIPTSAVPSARKHHLHVV
jgi:toxin-antitoxin system PIN domain toxin